MIRIEREPLKFLLRGKIIAVRLDKPRTFHKARTYAVALPGKRSATCWVRVLEQDGLELRIRQAPDAEDKPRMLRRGFGYVTDGDPLEAGECLPAGVTAGIAEDARRRFEQLRAEEQKRQRFRSLAIRFRAASRAQDYEALHEIGREVERLEQNA